MTKGGRRRGRTITCLSCRGVLDGPIRSFCDDKCEAYAQEHGYGCYSASKAARGIVIKPRCTCWLHEDIHSPLHDPRHCPMYGDREV